MARPLLLTWVVCCAVLWDAAHAGLLTTAGPRPPTPCSEELQRRFAPAYRRSYPLVIGVFTGENDHGYVGYTQGGDAASREHKYRKRRDGVRQSWKVDALASGVPVFFALSAWNVSAENRREAEEMNDIAFMEDRDGSAWGYQGLSVKTLRLMQYVARQCARFKYLLKSDDDTFVSIPRLIAFLGTMPATRCRAGSRLVNRLVLIDGPWGNPRFIRDTALDMYPIFVQGGGYVVTSDIVRTLALLGHMMPLSEYGSVEDTVLATWLLGWNISTIPFGDDRYIDFESQSHDGCHAAMCADQWLLMHHVFVATLPRYHAQICVNNSWGRQYELSHLKGTHH
eukprot:EG_transcript_13509